MSRTKKILRPIVGTILSACVAAIVLWVGSFIFTPTVGWAVLFLLSLVVSTVALAFALDRFVVFLVWLFTDD